MNILKMRAVLLGLAIDGDPIIGPIALQVRFVKIAWESNRGSEWRNEFKEGTMENPRRASLVLGSPSKADLNSASSQIVSSLRNVEGTENGGPNLSFVNGAWVDKTFGLKASFEELVKNVYRSAIEEVDFKNKAEEVAKEVNSWTEKETNGLIRELLPPGYINKKTVLVLGNALYFKGAWNGKKFDPTMTETKSFHLLNGGNVQVPFMTSMPYEEYSYRSFKNYKILAIPYHQSGRTPLKFTMELTELLSDCSKGDRILVSKIVQKAFVEVSEEGTEAAASTDAVLDYEVALFNFPSPPKPKPILFVADHPFLFMIRKRLQWLCSSLDLCLTHSWILEHDSNNMMLLRFFRVF
ncbi:hypothetical protein K1719_047373 [Acacia pycnantha]|nr:hypothetical protein K1719_047373 [Acacia pycnantha]